MTQWGHQYVIDFYSTNRNLKSELYDSEKALIYKLKKKKIVSILDYGCSTGGFLNIFSSIFKNFKYCGLDSEKKAIEFAKKKFNKRKKVYFFLQKGSRINFRNKSFVLSFCTSVLHHIKEHKKITEELFRISSKYIFLDLPRVHIGNDFVAKLDLSKRLPTQTKKSNFVYNYTVNLTNYLNYLKKLFKKNKVHKALFYFGVLPDSQRKYLFIKKRIFFLTVLCEKTKTHTKKFQYKIISRDKKIIRIFDKTFQ